MMADVSAPVIEATPAPAPAPTVYRLSPEGPRPDTKVLVEAPWQAVMLRENAAWFCHLRWLVVAVLVLIGFVSLMPTSARCWPGANSVWPWAVAAAIALSNLVYQSLLWFPTLTWPSVRTQLWAQIGTDLIFATFVIHFAGSTQTYAPMLYLFHIVLSCIFLSSAEGLAVTLAAAVLYTACVIAERAGLWPTANVLWPALGPGQAPTIREHVLVQTSSLLAIWLVIWYLVSRLAGRLQRRELELAVTNYRLVASGGERMRHMLQTTHQLKAPFAAIHAQVQLLLDGTCGDLPEAARRISQRIADRCTMLSQQIQDMLQLANLRSESQGALPRQEIDLATFLETCAARITPAAAMRSILIAVEAEPLRILAAEDHLRMLLDNLIANAVNYSRNCSKVTVRAWASPGGSVTIRVTDQGIGIPPDKLPRIFDDFYRTTEAVRHNPASTGLGLAIVRDVARADRIDVEVTSAPGQGTQFDLIFPSRDTVAVSPLVPGGTTHGLSDDR